MKNWHRTLLLCAVFVSALVYYAAPGLEIPVYSRGEAREAVVATDMLLQSDFVLPLRNGVDIPSKPPLFHWLAVGGARIFGDLDAWTVRLPSAICSALTLTLYASVAFAEGGVFFAFLVTAMIASGFDWIRYSTVARVDMVFACCLNIALVSIWHLVSRWRKDKSLSILFSIALTLGTAGAVLAKGPAGIALLVAVSGAFLMGIWIWGGTSPWRSAPWVAICSAWALGSCMGATWYIAAWRHRGAAFIEVQLLKENAARLVGNVDVELGHQHSNFYTIAMLFQSFAPWCILLPMVVFFVWKNRKHLAIEPQKSHLLLLAAWCSLMLVAVLVASSKRSVYFLPAFPAFAYLVASLISGEMPYKPRVEKWIFVFLIGLLILICTVAIAGPVSMGVLASLLSEKTMKNPNAFLVMSSLGTYSYASTLLFFAIIAGLFALKKFRRGLFQQGSIWLSGSILLLTVFTRLQVILPLAQENSPKSFVAQNKELIESLDLYYYEEDNYPFVFYAAKDLGLMTAEDLMSLKKTVAIVTKENAIKDIEASPVAVKILALSKNRAAEGRERLAIVEVSPIPSNAPRP